VDVVRHFTNLSRKNFGVDTGPYPLGSCTMKYNPKRNDAYAELPGFRDVHPLQPAETVPGLRTLYAELQRDLAELTGMHAFDLSPAAGAHGELKGLLIARRHFAERGETHRCEVVVPDSAHGTNPATATMVGFNVKIVPTRPDGLIDIDALESVVGPATAVVMLTNPSTLGLFEREIERIARAAHRVGALLYYDGANMNALMGLCRPGDMGFDIMHINVHKTLATPHGGGGPGAGPVGVRGDLARFISGGFAQTGDTPLAAQTKIKAFHGHVGVLVRAYAYIRTMGPDGLRQASMDAILNANYLQARLRDVLPAVFDTYCMHECLLDGSSLDVPVLDLAKRMIDYGIHPPTLMGAGCVYFDRALNAAMLFEPTETESKESLDQMVRSIQRIFDEIKHDRALVEKAPHSMSVSRLSITVDEQC
jgi:glycine dehydrogenase subunit 2